jgi:hypothetical protein
MTFKLLDSFEGLLDREVIAADLEKKNIDLVRAFGADLKDVADIFATFKDRPVVNKNSAPHSGVMGDSADRSVHDHPAPPGHCRLQCASALLLLSTGTKVVSVVQSMPVEEECYIQ